MTSDLPRRLRTLRVLQLALVACLCAAPALTLATTLFPSTLGTSPDVGRVAGAGLYFVGVGLCAVFITAAHALAERLGERPSMTRGTAVALALIPCVSIIGLPLALVDIARSFARLTCDDGLVRRTAVAAGIYPLISLLSPFAAGALVGSAANSLGPTATVMAFTLPSFVSEIGLAAATYFLAVGARAAVERLGAAGATGGAAAPAAVSI